MKYLFPNSWSYPSSISLREGFFEVVYPIDIDNFPPFFREEKSPDDSKKGYSEIWSTWHKHSEGSIEIFERDDAMTSEYRQYREIQEKTHESCEHHHQERIKNSFHISDSLYELRVLFYSLFVNEKVSHNSIFFPKLWYDTHNLLEIPWMKFLHKTRPTMLFSEGWQ